jgi:hypothetical protein
MGNEQRYVIVFILFLFFSVIYNGTAQTSDENTTTDSGKEYINIEVLFSDYTEDSIHFTYIGDEGSMWESWEDIVEMKVISGEYENKIFMIIIGEYPVRDQFKSSNINRIAIDKTHFTEYLYYDGHYHISSSYIKFIE